MKTFEFENLNEAYPKLIKTLMEGGKEVSPRGMLTKEISPVGITINNPKQRVISHPIRNLNYGFMIGELLWILQGSNNVDHIAHYNKQWEKYTDDGKILNGAYGQRIFNWDANYNIIYKNETDDEGNTHPTFDVEDIVIDQFESSYHLLKNNPDTRQATITLFNPYKDYTNTKDKPCTNLIRFMIRDNKLNMTVFMRSNDIILGLPYDCFNFTMLQEIMAGRLDIKVGKYTHIVDSLHIYKMHFEKAKKIINNEDNNNIYLREYDARINDDKYKEEIKKIFNVESISRNLGMMIEIETLVNKIDEINNKYWQSLAAFIAMYNLRKVERTQEELNILKEYITNEFKYVMDKYNELKKK